MVPGSDSDVTEAPERDPAELLAERMVREPIVKEDGRYLVYYRFEGA